MGSIADPRHADPSALGLVDLTKETLATSGRLVEAQIELMRAEMKKLGEDAKQRGIMLGIGVGFSAVTATLLLITVALAIAAAVHVDAAWFVGGATLLCGIPTALGYAISLRRGRAALAASRETINKELAWAKQNLPVPSAVSNETSNESGDAAKL